MRETAKQNQQQLNSNVKSIIILLQRSLLTVSKISCVIRPYTKYIIFIFHPVRVYTHVKNNQTYRYRCTYIL